MRIIELQLLHCSKQDRWQEEELQVSPGKANQYAPGQSRAQNKGGVLLHSDIRAVETLQDQVQTSHGAQSLSVVHLQHGQEASERIIMMDHPGAVRRSWSAQEILEILEQPGDPGAARRSCTLLFPLREDNNGG